MEKWHLRHPLFLILQGLQHWEFRTYGIRECARVRDNKEELSRTVQELLIISGITTAITYGVFFLLLFVVPQFRGQKELLIVIGASIGLTTIGVQWFYSALEQYSYITVCAVLFKIIGLILMFLLVKKPEDYVIYGAVYAIGTFGLCVLNFCGCAGLLHSKKQGKYNLQRHREGIIIFLTFCCDECVFEFRFSDAWFHERGCRSWLLQCRDKGKDSSCYLCNFVGNSITTETFLLHPTGKETGISEDGNKSISICTDSVCANDGLLYSVCKRIHIISCRRSPFCRQQYL